MTRFAGQTVVVTGAAGTIGRAVAARFAQEGASLVLVGSGRTPLDDVRGDVEAAGAKSVEVEADVTTAAGVQSYVAAAREGFGRVDVLVNNAGVEGAVGPLLALDDEEFDRVMASNVRSCFLGIKHTAPLMVEQGGGVIVNMSSVAGVMGVPLVGAYVASKHAILGLTKAAAAELAPTGVRINTIMPGVVESPMMRRIEEGAAPVLGAEPADAKAAYTALAPLGRYGTPQEVAGAVTYLAQRRRVLHDRRLPAPGRRDVHDVRLRSCRAARAPHDAQPDD